MTYTELSVSRNGSLVNSSTRTVMGKKNPSVLPLEDLAFLALYKDVTSSLLLSPEHRPKYKQLDYIASSSITTTSEFHSSNSILYQVDAHLTQHLIGSMGDKIRQQLLNKFYQNLPDGYLDNRLSNDLPDVWPYLDCIMNDGIHELKMHASYPDTLPNSKLIPTIAERSLALNRLSIDFILLKKDVADNAIDPFIASLHLLTELTSLSLFCVDEKHRGILKLLGNACPSLIHLDVSGFIVKQSDVLSVVLGQEIEKVFPGSLVNEPIWTIDSLQLKRVAKRCLSPFCFRLEHLYLQEGAESDEWIQPGVIAFMFQHMPNLKQLDHLRRTSEGISILAQCFRRFRLASRERTNEISCIGFKAEGQNVIPPNEDNDLFLFDSPENYENNGRNEIVPFCIDENDYLPFTRTLKNLTDLDFISILNPKVLEQVGGWCPSLINVKFVEEEIPPFTQISGRQSFSEKEKNDVSLDNITSIFVGWPKLRSITLCEISPGYAKIIIASFNQSLEAVAYDSCQFIDLTTLIPCIKVEMLHIVRSSSVLLGNQGEPKMAVDNFLPKLQTLRSDVCLGPYSYLFDREFKLLQDVTLSCSHFQQQILQNHRLTSLHGWCIIPKTWQRLESFYLKYCDDMTLAVLSPIICQLPHLRRITLPSSMEKKDPETALLLRNLLEDRSPRSVLDFMDTCYTTRDENCPYFKLGAPDSK